MPEARPVSTRVPPKLRREIRVVVKLFGLDQSEVLRRALAKGLREVRLELAVQEFREGRASLGKAAELAGLSVFELADELQKRRVPLAEYSLEEALADIAAVRAWKP